ncbi:hypothetical protein SCLO_1015260 [Sphingobium cloacae]|uniref:17 kDa surface antigen n=2 Tax=Sphingobium cloacae TaxID=120107 RepID=A0A1E1F221_9SPHN|nr:hypothetical protein SCLO_1015260 [Sphingobium cloacae]
MMGSLALLALVGASLSPAEARPRYGHGGWNQGGWNQGGWGHGGWGGDRWRHRRGNGFGVGDAIGVAALIGAVAVVASSMSKDRKAASASGPGAGRAHDGDYDDDGAPPADGTDYGADRRNGDFSDIADASGADASGADADRQDDSQMSDACAVAARDEAQAQGGYAEVRHMDAPRATSVGYNIDGDVETRASWSASGGTTRRFTCAMRDGRVAEVYLSRDVASR